MIDRNPAEEPSSAEGEIDEPDRIANVPPENRESDRATYGSEGGRGDKPPSHPRERKRKS